MNPELDARTLLHALLEAMRHAKARDAGMEASNVGGLVNYVTVPSRLHCLLSPSSMVTYNLVSKFNPSLRSSGHLQQSAKGPTPDSASVPWLKVLTGDGPVDMF